ncbi:SMI1/KNR4 family protein [Brevibacillus antibioticus]|uniref:SMI1/KNR4 family protein n=1 Tax=Brevibacillus antibioticus TaxID=2570228 RepID=A0A4U2Y9K8_9BACL|nr:SMI1/KNR4 family protein [Brevibacillus antibioticus]TKI57396.1 SMI1/KNR4 family protein [Brevibacillus antibioticus]
MLKELMIKISKITGMQFVQASKEEIEKLESLNLPEDFSNYFLSYNGTKKFNLGDLRLCSIANVLVENNELVPGRDVSKYGYIVFASNSLGDAYCFDLSKEGIEYTLANTPIVMFDHEEDYEIMNKQQVSEYAEKIADNLVKFLQEELKERD